MRAIKGEDGEENGVRRAEDSWREKERSKVDEKGEGVKEMTGRRSSFVVVILLVGYSSCLDVPRGSFFLSHIPVLTL